jgi:protein gp37
MRQARRQDRPGGAYRGLTRIGKHGVDWSGRVRLVPEQLGRPIGWKKPRRIFVDSMSDLFHHSLSNDDIAAVFGVMAVCPRHTFQILTKRPERMREWFGWVARDGAPHESAVAELCHRDVKFSCDLGPGWPWPLPNVWLGVSIENQARTDRLAPLCATPAAVRFVSAEPLLEKVTLGLPAPAIHWVIVGGESGNGARPFDVGWARALVRECKAAGVACFVKQVGRYPHVEFYDRRPGETGREWERRERPHFLSWPSGTRFGNPLFPDRIDLNGRIALLSSRKGGDMAEWPRDLRVREWPRAVA